MTRAGLTVLIAWLAGLTLAQVAVPTFGTRGDVSADVLAQVMSELRGEIARQTGLTLTEGELATAGIAGGLEPQYAYIIAQLDGVRYALSGVVRQVEAGGPQSPYTLSVMVADEQAQRSSDVLSESFSLTSLPSVAERLAAEVARFVAPVPDTPELAAGTAELFVSSQPGGATLYIDGVEVGATSELGMLTYAPGTYTVELRKEGYLSDSRTITLHEGKPEFVNVMLTEVIGGSVQVSSTPHAEVLVDGVSAGRTPLTVQARPGTHRVSLRRPGFETLSLDVPIQNYRVTQVNETLAPIFRRMLFWDESAGLLLIDGVLQTGGFAPNVPPGNRRFELRSGGQTTRFTAEVPASGVLEVDVLRERLRPLE